MREFNALAGYPQPKEPRLVSPLLRTIRSRIIAAARGKEYYDGDRNNGYGGFRYDGRWQIIAQNMCKEYGVNGNSSVLQINPEKGFLLHDFRQLYPAMNVQGMESSDYAMQEAMPSVRSRMVKVESFKNIPFADKTFDLVIALSVVYCLTLADAIACLKEIQRVSKGKSFVTLASYRTKEEYWLFRYWTVLGWTILSEEDWKEVLASVGYTGDYWFVNARYLNLQEKVSD